MRETELPEITRSFTPGLSDDHGLAAGLPYGSADWHFWRTIEAMMKAAPGPNEPFELLPVHDPTTQAAGIGTSDNASQTCPYLTAKKAAAIKKWLAAKESFEDMVPGMTFGRSTPNITGSSNRGLNQLTHAALKQLDEVCVDADSGVRASSAVSGVLAARFDGQGMSMFT